MLKLNSFRNIINFTQPKYIVVDMETQARIWCDVDMCGYIKVYWPCGV